MACRYGFNCLRYDCWFEHPQGRGIDTLPVAPAASTARQKNAQVLIMRNDTGNFHVLLQLRHWAMPVMPGHLAAVGGMRDRTDIDSSFTAVREVFEETGLLDVGHLPAAGANLRAKARERGSLIPQTFCKFGEGAQVDWWLLLLSGPGTFETAEDGRKECADISTLLPSLPGAQLAPCFGHAWLPANRINEIPEFVQLMGGLQRRVREALDVLGARPVRQFH
eukprot:symbB.v1.2.008144.t1/scaffold509.1/size193965/14